MESKKLSATTNWGSPPSPKRVGVAGAITNTCTVSIPVLAAGETFNWFIEVYVDEEGVCGGGVLEHLACPKHFFRSLSLSLNPFPFLTHPLRVLIPLFRLALSTFSYFCLLLLYCFLLPFFLSAHSVIRIYLTLHSTTTPESFTSELFLKNKATTGHPLQSTPLSNHYFLPIFHYHYCHHCIKNRHQY